MILKICNGHGFFQWKFPTDEISVGSCHQIDLDVIVLEATKIGNSAESRFHWGIWKIRMWFTSSTLISETSHSYSKILQSTNPQSAIQHYNWYGRDIWSSLFLYLNHIVPL